jgi:predicted glycosyltransferase
MKGSNSVLVAVLDWGLGHATRCIPVIQELQKQNARVVVGGSGLSLRFLQAEFPDLAFYELPSYGVVYPEKRSMLLSMLRQLPKINRAIRRERKQVEEIIQKEKVDFILSDNRYGCYSNQVKSIFIGHQLNIQMPSGLSIFSGFVNRQHWKRIQHFDQVWIPDQENGFHFSGILSETPLAKTKRIGILSRFSGAHEPAKETYEIVALLSGPEPQRSIFENKLRGQLQMLKRKSLMLKGKPGIHERTDNGSITEINHVSSKELQSILASADLVVARSGYSTIMDLAALGKKAILIPTPGQTEQEYLTRYLSSSKMAYNQAQDKLDLVNALTHLSEFGTLPKTEPNTLLPKAIQELVGR